MDSLIGKKLGQVQIEALIGRGGVAEVYLGTHTTLERKVAIKILRNINEDNPDQLERFKREARVVAKLRHPNIVQVHDFDTVDNNPYLVMEYIGGPSLSKYLSELQEKNSRLPLPQVVRLIRAVASALQYAHNNGVIHRDVKPGNILLTSPSTPVTVGKPLPEDFEPVLTDFGLVRFLDSSRQTTTGHVAGTPAYMSPEQSRGETTDGRADVYSLGVVLYEMLAGDVPFDGESTVSILLKQVMEPPSPIPGLSPSLQSVLDHALAKNLKDRFQTPAEFSNALCAAVDTNTKYEAATVQFDASTVQFGPSTVQFDETPSALSPTTLPPPQAEPPAKPLQARWLRIALPLGIIILALGGFLWMKSPAAFTPGTLTATVPAATYTITDTILAPTPSSTQTAVLPVGPIGILYFQNGSAFVDRASLVTQAMPAPPPGRQYEIWLTGTGGRLSLGIFTPDKNGRGELTFSARDSVNLISRYDAIEITIEPNPDTDPKPSDLIAYSFTLPKEGLTHVRFLLSTFPKTPDKTSLIQGLYADMKQIDQLAKEMQGAFEDGDEKTMQAKAETALNLLVGAQSPDYKDWNGDGRIDPRGSYGLLVNGNNFGYIQAVFAEADSTITTSDATEYMIDNGKAVKTCAQNITQWAADLRNLLLTILDPTADASRAQSLSDLVALTDRMLNGIDLDNNGKVDAVAAECGVQTVYERAYHMADMPILPAGISYQLTAMANSTAVPRTVGPGDNSGSTQVANTPKPHPTQKPHPTKKPPPGGGGNPGKTKVPKN